MKDSQTELRFHFMISTLFMYYTLILSFTHSAGIQRAPCMYQVLRQVMRIQRQNDTILAPKELPDQLVKKTNIEQQVSIKCRLGKVAEVQVERRGSCWQGTLKEGRTELTNQTEEKIIFQAIKITLTRHLAMNKHGVLEFVNNLGQRVAWAACEVT